MISCVTAICHLVLERTWVRTSAGELLCSVTSVTKFLYTYSLPFIFSFISSFVCFLFFCSSFIFITYFSLLLYCSFRRPRYLSLPLQRLFIPPLYSHLSLPVVHLTTLSVTQMFNGRMINNWNGWGINMYQKY